MTTKEAVIRELWVAEYELAEGVIPWAEYDQRVQFAMEVLGPKFQRITHHTANWHPRGFLNAAHRPEVIREVLA